MHISLLLLKVSWNSILKAAAIVFLFAAGYLVSENKNREWADWTGFGETTVTTTNELKKDRKGQIQKTPIKEEISSEKTLWDVLELGSRLLVPVLIFLFGLWFQQREKERIDQQNKLESQIARDNLAEEAIQSYLNNMSKLLLDKELKEELFSYVELKLIISEKLKQIMYARDELNFLEPDNSTKDLARTQTITILRRLENDSKRQSRILSFLYDTELYGFIFKGSSMARINLSEAYLSNAKLQHAFLAEANLERASLYDANLEYACLRSANLQNSVLDKTNFQHAHLHGADLQHARLIKANLQHAYLHGADLQHAILDDVNLQNATLTLCRFQHTRFHSSVDFKGADLSKANLCQAVFESTKNLTNKQIKSACFWEKAIYKSEFRREGWVAIEPDNTNFIEELKEDKSSDPEELIDCSWWMH